MAFRSCDDLSPDYRAMLRSGLEMIDERYPLLPGPKYETLFTMLRRACKKLPRDMSAAIRSLPSVGSLPSPWSTWMLFSVFSYLRRQQQGRKLLRKHAPEAIPPAPALYERDQPIMFHLPGASEWKVELELTTPECAWLHNRVSGEEIRIHVTARHNFPSSSWFAHVKQYELSDPVIDRLLRLNPTLARIPFSISDYLTLDDLVGNGMLRELHCSHQAAIRNHEPDSHGLTIWALDKVKLVRRFLKLWDDPARRLWSAALIGDWILASELAIDSNDRKLAEFLACRAEECRTLRVQELRSHIGDIRATAAQLAMLYDAGAPDMDAWVQSGLRDDEWTDVVAVFLEHCDGGNWDEQIYAMLESGQLGTGCAKALLRRGYRVEDVIHTIASRDRELATAARLSLEYSPALTLPLVQKALRYDDPERDPWCDDESFGFTATGVACEMALVLVVVGLPWTIRELSAALQELDPACERDRLRALPLVLALDARRHRREAQLTESWKQFYSAELFQRGQQWVSEVLVRRSDEADLLREQAQRCGFE